MKISKGSAHKSQRRESKTRGSISDASNCDALPDDQEGIARGGVATPFPWKLHEMLEDSATEGNEWIVSWQSHGRSFLVHKPKLFVEKIMPTYFNQSKFASFQRQLNLYGFSRLTTGKDKGAYYHSCFVRGHRGLCRGMVRQKIKGTKVRRTLAPEEEPDFYKMTSTPVPLGPASMPPLGEDESADEVTDKRSTSPRRRSSTASSSSRGSIAKSSGVLSAKERALKLRSLSVVRDALKQTEMFCGDSNMDFDDRAAKVSSNSSVTSEHIPSVSPMESEESDSEETVVPVVSPPRMQQPTIMPTLPSSLLDATLAPMSSVRFHQMTKAQIKGGDLLFFEGKPFHYLEHLDTLPPRPPKVVKPTQAAAQNPYAAYAPRDSLQSLMRVDPQALMGGGAYAIRLS
ncbi:Heat stress transcription factor [Seminavis robusta]|uniref:Heat stress transcription factor n=1 Tax=Seminavis robusta TaxID=568900 RepID=A0A9N8EWJ4_9STRA|nr:Heat stress transcription factor [Seminavis robusta]|eukprot:Sro2226_g319820.1 Heat stress transcription factor (401) ;mRNA; r:5536-6738